MNFPWLQWFPGKISPLSNLPDNSAGIQTTAKRRGNTGAANSGLPPVFESIEILQLPRQSPV